MGRMSKNKGKRGELELSHWLTKRGHPARRGQQFQGSPDSPDVICESLPFHIECKRTEALRIYDALEQAQEDFIKNIVASAAKKYPKANIDFKVLESYRNMKLVLDNHAHVLEKAFKAVELAGIKAVKNIIRGGTDGARLSYMGLPTPNLFTGGSNFHSRQEWIALEDMQKASEVIVNMMRLWAE